MRERVAGAIVLSLVALSAEAAKQKIPPEFRSAFEGRVHRGSYAVMTQKGVPTTSVYGVDGQQTDAYYSVDVKGGAWQASTGMFDFNQVEADTLNLGEVVEIAQVSFKDGDNRIDVRTVSVEAHKVTRGGRTSREPVSTNFKFFFPVPLQSAQDVAQAVEYIEAFFKVFQREEEARAAAQIMAGGGAAPGHGSSKTTAKAEIKPGMTPLEVLDILGKPTKEITFQGQSKWTYPDLTVVFQNGRVKEVRF
jgi:hypothetical protein